MQKSWSDHAGSLEQVGRNGYLSLVYARHGRRTIQTRAFFHNPLQVFPPIELDDSDCAFTHLLNPTGGLVGGDRLTMDIRLEKGAHALITTPSATRLYRSRGETTIQNITLNVGPDAVLEWLPDTMIPFGGSRFQQCLQAHLARGATLFLWDALSSGRVARGERWAFSRFANELCVRMHGGRKALERYDLEPAATDLTAPGMAEGWDYFASFYVISSRIVDWAALLELLQMTLNRRPITVYGGISHLAIPGLAVRLVTKTAVDLARIHAELWDTSRRLILNIPAPSLRKY